MTDKELLYIDDTLGHLKQIETFCQDAVGDLEDESLQELVESFSKEHQDIFKKFYKMLEE